ncbi:zinc finger BED domain-containing protein 1-like [Sipha flava]|uniref:Zinc finger BED domain-containing protein 1-like n=1 Tax=Sipha flava TaxID=143950 RepID=A0A8B8GQ90_9HEMI|nr:zinc finger BED domain-containing protein 1-like [Sipha flava]
MLEEDWDRCEVLVKLLKPLQLATTILCSEQQITISMVRPLIGSLITKHLSSNQTDCVFATMFKNTVSKDLAKRFSMESGSEKNTNEILVNVSQIASLLDPRYKNLKFEHSEEIKYRIQPIVRSKVLSVNQISTTVCGNIQIAKKTILDELMGQFSDDDEDEFTRYLSEPQINHNDNPCLWWKARENVYPKISVLAKNILCIPASSASSERVFSTAGNIITPKRNQMTPYHLSALVFLKNQA